MTIEEIKKRIAEIEKETKTKGATKPYNKKVNNAKIENIKNFSPSFLGL